MLRRADDDVPAAARTRARGRQAQRQPGRRRAVRGVEPHRTKTRGSRRPSSARPRPEAFVDPNDLEPEQRALYRAAARGLPRGVRRSPGRAADLGWSTHLDGSRRRSRRPTSASRSSSPTAGASCGCSSSAPATRRAAARPVQLRVALGAHRGVGARSADDRRRRRHRAGARTRTTPISSRAAPKRIAWITERVELVQRARRRRARRAPAPTARAARSSPAATSSAAQRDAEAPAPRHRLDHAVELRRLRAVRAPVPQPPPARPPGERSRRRERDRACSCTTCCASSTPTGRAPTPTTSPTCSPGTAPTTTTCAQLVERHARPLPVERRPSVRARARRSRASTGCPPPMFMATARIDAVWVHDGLLDARDYKTGRLWRRARRRRSRGQGAGVRARRRGRGSAACGCGCATST